MEGLNDVVTEEVFFPIGSALCRTSVKAIEEAYGVKIDTVYREVRGGNSYTVIGPKK